MFQTHDAGIYIHIPYCKTKCNYCDFYSVVNNDNEKDFIDALLAEIDLRKNFFEQDAQINTIYFGGGTPSFIKSENIAKILNKIQQSYAINAQAEITLEANPDDLTNNSLIKYKAMGFNRLSIGVQSLLPEQLRFMQRRHNVEQAIDAVNMAVRNKFDNISVDLIYGLPDMQLNQWEDTLNTVMQWPVQHLSAYHLTIEEGTKLHKQVQKAQIKEISDDKSFQQFESLMDISAQHGFEQYEISNFARNKLYSKHNSAYWQQKAYLGLGPSAHSFSKDKRYWNHSSLIKYIDNLQKNKLFYAFEILSPTDKFNDMIITALRTSKGLNIDELHSYYKPKEHWNIILNKYIEKGFIIQKNTNFSLSRKGIHLADSIMADLMIIKE